MDNKDKFIREALFLKGWFEAGCQIHGTYSPKTDYDQIRYIANRLKKLCENSCDHEMKRQKDERYPYKPIRCVKCGHEP